MKAINISVLFGLVISVFLISGCITQQPTVLEGNQIEEVNDVITEPSPGNPVQLPLVSKTDAQGNIVDGQLAEESVEQSVQTLNITEQIYNNTLYIKPINTTGNYSNNTNST